MLDNHSFENKNIFSKQPSNFLLTSLSLNVAQLCNLNCLYCCGNEREYGNSRLMNKDLAFKAVNFLLKYSGKTENLNIIFFGGEPLINFSLIKEVVSYAQKKTVHLNKNIHYSITTNGSLLDDNINAFLNKHKFAVVINFDGDKKTQDLIRPLKGGGSSYDLILPKLKKFLISRNGNATARVTFTGKSENPEKIRNMLKLLGFNKVHLESVTVNKNKNLILSEYKIIELVDDIEKQGLEIIKSIKKRNIPEKSTILEYLKNFIYRSNKEYYCGAGKELHSISSEGKIYPCHRFVGNPVYAMGHLENETYLPLDEFHQSQIYSNHICKECWAKIFCGGGCYHINQTTTGDIFHPFGEKCLMITSSLKTAIGIYDNLDYEDRLYLKSILVNNKSYLNF